MGACWWTGNGVVHSFQKFEVEIPNLSICCVFEQDTMCISFSPLILGAYLSFG